MRTISGMNSQAEAFAHFLVLCEVLENYGSGLFYKRPYFNCRERGFVVSFQLVAQKAIHFAWFEHRNSDQLCCVKWEGPISGKHGDFFTVHDIPAKAYPDKWALSKSVKWGAFGEAAGWMQEEISPYMEKVAA